VGFVGIYWSCVAGRGREKGKGKEESKSWDETMAKGLLSPYERGKRPSSLHHG
jgi:hypothetical protein